jgi:class 3 adenylate cyclase
VACAVAISDAVRSVGIDVRIGIHMGEVEAVGDQLVGIAVHVGSRVASLAVAGEVLVTSTLRESMAGSTTVFNDRGTHELEGVPDEWRIFAIARDEATRPPKAPIAVEAVDEASTGGGSVVALMFTDVVGATRLAARLGDERWRKLLTAHNLMIRRNLDRFNGRKVDEAGDRVLATFDRTTQAVDCARAILDVAIALGVEMRIGIHVGEVEMVGPKVGGAAVHVGARVLTVARPGELLVTSTAKDSLLGTRRLFEDRGVHRMKGLADDWHVYAVR